MRYQSRMHPTLDILCDSMGRVFVPANRTCKAHWTFGSNNKYGYRTVTIDNKTRSVSRLICETFHGLAPEDRPTCDHINRNRDSNVPENLRWANMHMQSNNRQMCEDSKAKYGVRQSEDRKAYQRAYYRERYANDPEYAERERARKRELRAKNPEYAERQRAYNREYLAKKRAKQKALAVKEN